MNYTMTHGSTNVNFKELSYWKLKAEAVYLMLRKNRVGKGYGPVVREPRGDDNDDGDGDDD